MIIDGKAIADRLITALKKKEPLHKILAVVFVGDNVQSQSFLRQKEKVAGELGIQFDWHCFPDTIEEGALISEIEAIGKDAKVGGIIVQLPLPAKFNRDRVIAVVASQKDIDALTPAGKKFVDPLPVAVLKEILRPMAFDLSNKIVAVVGRGFLIGQPIIEYFQGQCRDLIILDTKSDFAVLQKADLVVSGVGKAGVVKASMLKNGAAVIDFGYDTKDGKIVGDFELDTDENRLLFYTPTPGGTGPILVAEI